jgi:hypothetical protein
MYNWLCVVHNRFFGGGGHCGLDGVLKTNNVGCCSWKVLMPRVQRCKPKKQKVPDDVLVGGLTGQTSNDVVDPQLLLCILQQGDEPLLRAIQKLVLSDGHVQPVLPEYSVPLAPEACQPWHREGELHCLVRLRLRLSRKCTASTVSPGFTNTG